MKPWEMIPPFDTVNLMFPSSLLDNSGLNVTNTYVAYFYRWYFYHKIYAIMDIQNLPDTMDMRYFKNVLLGKGYIGVFDTEEYGLICNAVSFWDIDIYNNPTRIRGVSPKFKQAYERRIVGSIADPPDAVLVKLSPNFETVLPIINYFGDMMAVAVQGIDSNVLNSKLAYVFACDNQNVAESFKKMFDEIINGYPAVFADKKLIDSETGNLKMEMFNRSVRETYIADKLIELKTAVENEFNSYIGLTSVNTEKKERLITPEIELSNNNNKLIIELWQDTINEGLEKVNEMFGTDIKCRLNINYLDGDMANVETKENTDI